MPLAGDSALKFQKDVYHKLTSLSDQTQLLVCYLAFSIQMTGKFTHSPGEPGSTAQQTTTPFAQGPRSEKLKIRGQALKV